MEKVLRVEDSKYVAGEVIGAEVELMKLLWENPSPSAEFAAQTISLDLSGYDFVRIVYATGNNTRFYSQDVEKNGIMSRAGLIGSDGTGSHGTFSWWREATVTNSGVTFTAASSAYTGAYTEVDNGRGVPVRIYGIKNKLQTIANDVSTSASKCMMSDGETSVEDALNKLRYKLVSSVTSTASTSYRQVLTSLYDNLPSKYKSGLHVDMKFVYEIENHHYILNPFYQQDNTRIMFDYVDSRYSPVNGETYVIGVSGSVAATSLVSGTLTNRTDQAVGSAITFSIYARD